MDVDLFDFELPESRIAQTPLADRSASRLLTLNKVTGEVRHQQFADIVHMLQAGDTLVLNDTRVLPARLFGYKQHTNTKIEVLLLKNVAEDCWEVLVRPGKRAKKGTILHFGPLSAQPLLTAVIAEETAMGGRVLRFSYTGIFHQLLDQLGAMPLPPYVKERLEDRERYQTVYAKMEGSAAAPTAGLHFTKQLLHEIEQKGVSIAYITLHVGLGTFRPVSVKRVEEHEMHSEYYEISPEAASVLNQARDRDGKIIAVGTTSARTLETISRDFGAGAIVPSQGWTNIFIYPGYKFTMVDAMLTNFHLPKSTLIMLISALAGREHILEAYREAIEHDYRFYSFGDAMFIY